MASLMALLSVSSSFAAEFATKVASVSVRPGVTMQYLEIIATERPRAVVVLMAGGKGVLGLRSSGEIGTDLKLNFLMRARDQFAREGMIVAALDVASDQMAGLNGDIRLSGRHAHDIVKVIADLRKRHNMPDVARRHECVDDLGRFSSGTVSRPQVRRPRRYRAHFVADGPGQGSMRSQHLFCASGEHPANDCGASRNGC
jgi:hypothetical protein